MLRANSSSWSRTAPPIFMTANLAGWVISEDEEKMRRWRSTSRLVPIEYKSRVIVSCRIFEPGCQYRMSWKFMRERGRGRTRSVWATDWTPLTWKRRVATRPACLEHPATRASRKALEEDLAADNMAVWSDSVRP